MSKKFSDCAIEDNQECKMNKMPKLMYAPLSAQRSTEQGSAPLTPNRSGKGGLLYSYLKEKLSIAKSQLSDEDNLKLQVESQPTYTPREMPAGIQIGKFKPPTSSMSEQSEYEIDSRDVVIPYKAGMENISIENKINNSECNDSQDHQNN